MPALHYYTADIVRDHMDAGPPGTRYELVYGELLVSPAPRAWHQEIVGRLYVALREYLARENAGHVFMSPADISWSEDTLVQPDVFVFPVEEARPLDWRQMKSLMLCAEVLSPTSLRADRFPKRRLYQDKRVPLYWIVDGDLRRVETWRPEQAFPEIEENALAWRPQGASEPFTLSLTELFRPL